MNRTLDAVLNHVILHSNCSSQRAGAQQVVAAAVSVAAIADGSVYIVTGFLAQTGQSIKLAQQSDCRMALAPDTYKSGGSQPDQW